MNWFSVPVSCILSTISRVSLLSVILFELKEEHAGRISSDVDKGGGEGKKEEKAKGSSGTFVALNMMVGLWAVGGECCEVALSMRSNLELKAHNQPTNLHIFLYFGL